MKRTTLPILTFVAGVLLGTAASTVGGVPATPPADGLVRGIGGVFLRAEDPASLNAWYRDHLGMEIGDFGADFLWTGTGEDASPGRTVWNVFPDDTDYFGPSDQQCMINYIVTDMDAALARLAERGVEPTKEPEAYPYGRFAWVRDAAGNRIELWEPAAPPEG